MMLDEDFDARISDWLRDGPDEVPRRAVAAAVAHAQAHPRLQRTVRLRFLATGRAAGGAGLLQDRRRGLALAFGGVAVAAAVGVILFAGTGVLSPIRLPSSPEAPAVAPQTSFVPLPTVTTGATPSPSPAAASSDLAGTWSGTVVEPAPVDPTTNYQRDPTKDTTWSLTLDLKACGRGDSCGTLTKTTSHLGGSGDALDCSATLGFGGVARGGVGYVFDEKGARAGCDVARIAVTPSADGATVAIEETTTGNTLDSGTLDRVERPVTPSATTATATPDPVSAATAIAGTWTGTIILPPTSIDPLSHVAYQSDQVVLFDATIDLSACAIGARCGTLERRVDVWPPTGQPLACAFALTSRGFYEASAALSFEETAAAAQAKECAPARLVVAPLTSGLAIAVEETGVGMGTFDHGVLVRSRASSTAGAGPSQALTTTTDPAVLAVLTGEWTRFTSPATVLAFHGACDRNATCGSLTEPSLSVRPCDYDLFLRGSDRSTDALSFDGLPSGALGTCPTIRLVVTPLTSGTTVAVEEMVEGSTTTPRVDVLTRTSSP